MRKRSSRPARYAEMDVAARLEIRMGGTSKTNSPLIASIPLTAIATDLPGNSTANQGLDWTRSNG